jgi:hypothetical protein
MEQVRSLRQKSEKNHVTKYFSSSELESEPENKG